MPEQEQDQTNVERLSRLSPAARFRALLRRPGYVFTGLLLVAASVGTLFGVYEATREEANRVLAYAAYYRAAYAYSLTDFQVATETAITALRKGNALTEEERSRAVSLLMEANERAAQALRLLKTSSPFQEKMGNNSIRLGITTEALAQPADPLMWKPPPTVVVNPLKDNVGLMITGLVPVFVVASFLILFFSKEAKQIAFAIDSLKVLLGFVVGSLTSFVR